VPVLERRLCKGQQQADQHTEMKGFTH
jgi:hypothetical protein